MSRFDILVLGDYFLDLVFTGLPAFPELGKEIFASGFAMLPGGAFNSAAAMQRLGLRVGWAVDFGADDFSRFVLAQAAAEGLDEALFVHHDRPLRRITVSASYPQDRAFITYMDPDPAMPAAMKALATTTSRAAYLPGVYYGKLFTAGLLLLRAKRMKLIMDGNSGDDVVLTNPAVRRAVQSADLFLPNASEARRLTGQTDLAQALDDLAALCRLVVVKDGGNGAYACAGGQIIQEPAISAPVIDTTGAGDCFNAGFVKAWLEGRSLADCLRWGNVVGGLSTTERGGTTRVVTSEEVAHWLAR